MAVGRAAVIHDGLDHLGLAVEITMDRSFLEQALRLSAEDRAVLANELLLSLETSETSADSDEALDALILARVESIVRGESTSISMEESLERMRRVLDEEAHP